MSYSWSLHLPLPLPMFYRLYGASEGKDLLAKAKTRIPPVPGTPFDLILGNKTHNTHRAQGHTAQAPAHVPPPFRLPGLAVVPLCLCLTVLFM